MSKSYLGAAGVAAVALLLAACGSSSGGSSSSSATSSGSGATTGKVGVILPDATTSPRWESSDRPSLQKAFDAAGYTYDIQNATKDVTKFSSICDAMIAEKVNVLMIVNLDSASGAACESKAKAAGIPSIDYDRLTLNGDATYYVSFDNVQVGKLMGQGLVDCLTTAGKTKANVAEVDGDPTDNNAKLFAQGYNGVLQPYFADGSYIKVGEPAGTWDPPTAQTTFQQQYTAHPNINAVVTPNDDNANAVISVLKGQNIPPNTFPTTGQDASTPGLQNILTGYQCGTVYKPIYLEAQAAAALALFLRAGITPPAALANATTQDTVLNKAIKSVYTTPLWVTTENMASTVVKDGAAKADKLCAGAAASACAAAGIK